MNIYKKLIFSFALVVSPSILAEEIKLQEKQVELLTLVDSVMDKQIFDWFELNDMYIQTEKCLNNILECKMSNLFESIPKRAKTLEERNGKYPNIIPPRHIHRKRSEIRRKLTDALYKGSVFLPSNSIENNGNSALSLKGNFSSNYISVFKYAVLEKATPEDSQQLTDQVKIEVITKNTSNYHVRGHWGVSYYPGRAEKYINDFDRCMIKFVEDFAASLDDAIYGIRECQKKTNQLPHVNAKFEM